MTGTEEERQGKDGAPAGDHMQRLDKWLWYARLYKSRTLAAQLVAQGKVRINRARTVKPSQTVKPGDVLTIALRGQVHLLRFWHQARAAVRRSRRASSTKTFHTASRRPTRQGEAPGAARARLGPTDQTGPAPH